MINIKLQWLIYELTNLSTWFIKKYILFMIYENKNDRGINNNLKKMRNRVGVGLDAIIVINRSIR